MKYNRHVENWNQRWNDRTTWASARARGHHACSTHHSYRIEELCGYKCTMILLKQIKHIASPNMLMQTNIEYYRKILIPSSGPLFYWSVYANYGHMDQTFMIIIFFFLFIYWILISIYWIYILWFRIGKLLVPIMKCHKILVLFSIGYTAIASYIYIWCSTN